MGAITEHKESGIVAFGFGTPSTLRSNQILVGIVSEFARNSNMRVYTHRDIQPDNTLRVEYAEETANTLTTLQLARSAIEWAKRNNITVLWVAAAEPHVWRCVRDLRCCARIANYDIRIAVFSEIKQQANHLWFSPESKQIHTRSRIVWYIRESILRLIPFSLYTRIVS